MITCGHCGDQHATVAEVRSCDGQLEASHLHEPEAPPPLVAPPTRTGDVAAFDLSPNWPQLAGPAPLGRSVIVGPNQPAPSPWEHAPRLVIDPSAPTAEVITALQRHWSQRTAAVLELTAPLPERHPVSHAQPWELTVDFDLAGERVRHLVTANAVDAHDAQAPTFAPTSAAVAAGASVDGPADVVDRDGAALWSDGGPLSWFDPTDLDGHPLVPAAHLDIGVLAPLTHGEPNAELAPDQLAAVTHHGGGARIIAPAGSGKTRVLTERARHLISDRGIHPSAVCLVAFNVRARAEMQERTTDLPGLEIRTLNSLALAIVAGSPPFRRPRKLQRRPEVIDERGVRRVLADLVQTRRQAMADPYAVWIEALTACRLGLRSPGEVESDFGGDVKDFAEVLPAYRRVLAEQSWLDFDEQILGAIEVLLTDPEARTRAREVCRLLLVDEFQDLTPAHVLLVRLLAGPPAEVFGVGDDDQTIYGYSGASPTWLIEFDRLFPGAVHHDLQVNYRCPPAVVMAASNLLSHNRRRVHKQIQPAPRSTHPESAPNLGLHVVADADPVDGLVRHIELLRAAGAAPPDIAVLTRVNATLLAPMIALGQAGIVVDRPIGAAFLSRTGVGATLAWLSLATGPQQGLVAAELDIAARRPPRALSRRTVEWIAEKSSVREIRELAGRLRDERDRDKVTSFADDLEQLRTVAERGATTAELLTAIRDDLGLGGALDRRLDASRRSVDRSAHGDDLAALLAIARFEPDPARFSGWLADQLALSGDDGPGVVLATVHKVKGREWPHVVVYEATAGLFPHRLANDREEERRVFHVALTRGVASTTVIAGQPGSPFLRELDEQADPGKLADPEPEPTGSRRSRTTTKVEVPPPDTLLEARLRERLRTWRLERARLDGVPAYVVFNDATLRELARLRPTSHSSMLTVPGIGPTKAERYGPAVIELVAALSTEAGG